MDVLPDLKEQNKHEEILWKKMSIIQLLKERKKNNNFLHKSILHHHHFK